MDHSGRDCWWCVRNTDNWIMYSLVPQLVCHLSAFSAHCFSYKYMIAEAAAQAAAAAATAATTPQPGKDARPKSIALNDITIESQHTEPSSNADQSVVFLANGIDVL